MSSNKKVILLLVGISVVYALGLSPRWKYSADSTLYVGLAESLVQGRGYEFNNESHVHVPPGVPLLFLPVILFGGRNFLLLRLLVTALAVGSVYLAYHIFRTNLSERVALLLAALLGGSLYLFRYSLYILSDVPFLFFSLAALLAVRSFIERKDRWQLRGVLAGLLVSAACMMRAVGAALLPAVALTLLFSARPKATMRQRLAKLALVISVALAPGLAWVIRCVIVAPEGAASYAQLLRPKNTRGVGREATFRRVVRRVGRNMRFYTGVLGAYTVNRDLWKPGLPPYIEHANLPPWWAGWALALLFAASFMVILFKRRRLVEWYVAAYACICLLIQPDSVGRYFLPLLPFLFYYLYLSLNWLKAKMQEERAGRGAWVWVGTAVVWVLACAAALPTKPFSTGLRSEAMPLLMLGLIVVLIGVLLVVFDSFRQGLAKLLPRILFPLVLSGYGVLSLTQIGFAIVREHDSNYTHGKVWAEPTRTDYLVMLGWIRDNTAPDAVIMTAGERTTFFLTGRRAVRPPNSSNPEELLARIGSPAVDYCLVEAGSENHMGRWADYLESDRERFRLRHRVGRLLLYAVKSSS